jgi:acetyltransferase-like isoleucine patch superfamily enzyme
MANNVIPARYNRRSIDFSVVPRPMAVSDAAIAICLEQVEGRLKRTVRGLLIPAVARRLGLRAVGEGLHWGRGVELKGAVAGRFVSVGSGSRLNGPVCIGDLTMISTNVVLVGDDHDAFDPSRPMRVAFPDLPRKPTIIEADCWIGHSAVIKEGVRIGRGSVIAAGGVVTRDVAPYSVVAGVPACVIRVRFTEEQRRRYELLLYGIALE